MVPAPRSAGVAGPAQGCQTDPEARSGLSAGPIACGAGTKPQATQARKLTESTGQVQVEVPRDRAGTFESQIVKKRRRRLTGVDEIVLSPYAKGLTPGEISAHFAEIYAASVSKETISRITGKVIEEMQARRQCPLDET